MILLAVIVGGLTAYYLGLRPGVIAAIVSAVALVVATFVPGAALPIYTLLALWCGGVWFVKAKLGGLVAPEQAKKKGWERELDRWKQRAAWLWKSTRK